MYAFRVALRHRHLRHLVFRIRRRHRAKTIQTTVAQTVPVFIILSINGFCHPHELSFLLILVSLFLRKMRRATIIIIIIFFYDEKKLIIINVIRFINIIIIFMD